jgi:hypothetical protein
MTAVKAFLRRGDINVLKEFLRSYGGNLGRATTETQVASLQAQATAMGRVLRTRDARIVGSAVNEGVPLLTADRRLYRFLTAAGIEWEPFI